MESATITHYLCPPYLFLICKNNPIHTNSKEVFFSLFIPIIFIISEFYLRCVHKKGMKELYFQILYTHEKIKTNRHRTGPRIKDKLPYENYKNILKDRGIRRVRRL